MVAWMLAGPLWGYEINCGVIHFDAASCGERGMVVGLFVLNSRSAFKLGTAASWQ